MANKSTREYQTSENRYKQVGEIPEKKTPALDLIYKIQMKHLMTRHVTDQLDVKKRITDVKKRLEIIESSDFEVTGDAKP